MARRDTLEEKLPMVQSVVRERFLALEARIMAQAAKVVEESGPGRGYWDERGDRILRLHPKNDHLCVGFPNSMREQVRQSEMLRSQKDSAWINVKDENGLRVAEKLLG